MEPLYEPFTAISLYSVAKFGAILLIAVMFFAVFRITLRPPEKDE